MDTFLRKIVGDARFERISAIAENLGDLSKGMKGSQASTHKYVARKPSPSGNGYLYDYGDGKGFQEAKGNDDSHEQSAEAGKPAWATQDRFNPDVWEDSKKKAGQDGSGNFDYKKALAIYKNKMKGQEKHPEDEKEDLAYAAHKENDKMLSTKHQVSFDELFKDYGDIEFDESNVPKLKDSAASLKDSGTISSEKFDTIMQTLRSVEASPRSMKFGNILNKIYDNADAAAVFVSSLTFGKKDAGLPKKSTDTPSDPASSTVEKGLGERPQAKDPSKDFFHVSGQLNKITQTIYDNYPDELAHKAYDIIEKANADLKKLLLHGEK